MIGADLWSARTTRAWLRLLAGRGGSLAIGAFVLMIVARGLEREELDKFLLHSATWGFTSLFALTGFVPVLVRDLARGLAGRGVVWRALFRSTLAGAAFYCVVLAFGHGADPGLQAVAASHVLLPLHLAAAPFLAIAKTGPVANSEIAGRLMAAIGVFACFLAEATTAGGFLFAATVGPPLGSALLLLANRQTASRRTQVGASGAGAELVVAAGDVVRAAYLHGSQWIAAAVFAASYGELGAAMRLFCMLAILPATLSTVLVGPLAQGGQAARASEVVRAVPRAFGLGALLALACSAVAIPVVGTVFPNLADPRLSVVCLTILVASLPAMFGASLCMPFLLAQRHEATVLGISIAGLATMLGVCVVARPLGVLAAAIALCVCEWLVFALSLRSTLTVRNVTREGARGIGARP